MFYEVYFFGLEYDLSCFKLIQNIFGKLFEIFIFATFHHVNDFLTVLTIFQKDQGHKIV